MNTPRAGMADVLLCELVLGTWCWKDMNHGEAKLKCTETKD